MKLNLNDGTHGEGFTLQEYNDATTSDRIPKFIRYLDQNFAGFREWYRPHEVERFYVECVQNYFTKEEVWWLRFDMDGLQFHFSCKASKYNSYGLPHFLVEEPIEISTYTDLDSRHYKFNGTTDTPLVSPLAPHPPRRENSVHTVVFYLDKRMWGCTHTNTHTGKAYTVHGCSHIREFIRAGHDASVIRTFRISEEQEMEMHVPVFDGLTLIRVVLTKHTEDEVLGNGGIETLIKFEINEDFEGWADEDFPSMSVLLEEFEGAMQNSFETKKWFAACVNLKDKTRPIKTVPCPHKYHTNKDTGNIALECAETGEGVSETGLSGVALANAVSVAVYGRCTSCVEVMNKMKNDYVKQIGREFTV